jgi:hypothetical protein
MADFTNDQVRILRHKLQEKLDEIQKELGVTLKVGNCRYLASTATFKLEVCKVGESGEISNPYAEAFKLHAQFYGLKATDLGRTFISGGNTYEIAGLNTKGKKYNILGKKQADGKLYKFAASLVALRLA